MNFVVVVLASLIPGLLWVRYFYLQDRFEPEPFFLLVRVFLAGAASVVFAALLEYPFSSFLTQEHSLTTKAIMSFLVIGLGEEFFKAAAVYFAAFKSYELNEPMDGIIYGITAGIGFSVVENILYTAAFGLSIVPFRAFTASLAHACFSGIFGAFCGRAKFGQEPHTDLIKGLLIAAFMHGLYDFILISQILSPLAAVIMVILSYLLLRYYIVQALIKSPFN
ncbi:MAG: PrsW family intramembrane metalloprotease [Firmicutes bacterium]|nr:PrsW family intramembrane metalloprotease [Bacillota bacterium]